MNIGFDIDNVISDYDSKLKEEMLIYDKKLRGSGIINVNTSHVKECFDWSVEEYENFKTERIDFISKNLPVKDGMRELLNSLRKEGHNVVLITHRFLPDMETATKNAKQWLKENDIPYNHLVITSTSDKTSACLRHKIDIFFDDRKRNCEQLRKAGIAAFMVKTDYNLNNDSFPYIVSSCKDINDTIKSREIEIPVLNSNLF